MGMLFAKILEWYNQVYGSVLPHALVVGEDCLYTSTKFRFSTNYYTKFSSRLLFLTRFSVLIPVLASAAVYILVCIRPYL